MTAGLGTTGRGGPRRVTRTGIALVHENEVVYPAAGSAAMAERAIADTSADVTLQFPVVIEIVGSGIDGGAELATDAAREELRQVTGLLAHD